MKSFFFDGVTNPAEIEATLSILQDSLMVRTDSSAVVLKIVDNRTLIHPPYKERACSKCHDPNAMGKPKMGLPDLCYTCHTSMEYKYEALHGPVENGSCTQCHSPHIAKIDKLLK